ncbi:hypothetical protein KY360_03990 [Candidatus Woesearchaeota archaeon]|nr:hypothetical protein [Candidatus Woesearchaeota archaeon]
MKKIIFLFLFAILLIWPFSFAEDGGMDLVTINVVSEEEPVELPENVVEEAGITPDNPLWGLERAIEAINVALTPGKSAKAKKGLAHARERLMETQAMIAARKLGAAEEAQEAHDDLIDDVSGQIAGLGNGDIAEELADEIELEEALNEHKTLVREVNNIRLKTKGLTAGQQAQLNGLVSSMEGSTVRAQFSVRARKDKTKTKIKATQGLSDEELEALEAQVKAAVKTGTKFKIVGRKAQSNAKGKFKTTEISEEEQNITPAAKGKANKDKNSGKGKNK